MAIEPSLTVNAFAGTGVQPFNVLPSKTDTGVEACAIPATDKTAAAKIPNIFFILVPLKKRNVIERRRMIEAVALHSLSNISKDYLRTAVRFRK